MNSPVSLDEFISSQVSSRACQPIKLKEPVPLADLHTPALVIDQDVMQANLGNMQTHLNAHGIGLRSHTKMHKCPIIAKLQMDAGAIGICAATVSEAEVMQAFGIDKILITSPVTTREKIARVLHLASTNDQLQIVVDHAAAADGLNQAAAGVGVTLQILIDLDPEMGRTGVELGTPALKLAQHIRDRCDHLRFSGLQCYAGHCMHIHGFEERRSRYRQILAKGLATRDLLVANDFAVPAFSGGGTGTYDIEPEIGGITDLQAGSYLFMDVEYRDIGGRDSERFLDFEPSLFVLVTAISQPQKRLITVDAGYKAFASDTVHPQFRDIEGAQFHWGGDEHGIIELGNPSREINLGDKLAMITSHCDPTVNLYDYYFPYRKGMVEEIWPIAARGRSQ
ncbi:MAG: DSD1 family PLP-dependent enzyme [Pseudomonadales bacterium]|jgi:D-serine deaminase-like pyridoxal phosphate-dependent protein|nr:DSD1 family PLP-dependent enzyme [Pseudomonadales bacterium]MDP7358461.1 DSD1 family PLP-dependent enzyme [Pseudomonadales bacterium]MDP7594904.1 DSD1 family PLP-dependent enzyme [Pseudomonadales bacterium]HJN49151.1 DSD1 family PLP-dependent enzyme [Pseudomonadales bacterium]|tara:strand:- start:89 stop:1273 length:1185 start_codon:yes stop_codon:yes gene_type:complete